MGLNVKELEVEFHGAIIGPVGVLIAVVGVQHKDHPWKVKGLLCRKDAWMQQWPFKLPDVEVDLIIWHRVRAEAEQAASLAVDDTRDRDAQAHL